jgi:hypothetical protein
MSQRSQRGHVRGQTTEAHLGNGLAAHALWEAKESADLWVRSQRTNLRCSAQEVTDAAVYALLYAAPFISTTSHGEQAEEAEVQ